MKWGLQHVKVTLEEAESGETVVIEQSSDGRVKCERGRTGKPERAANKAPPASEARPEKPVEAPETPRKERPRGESKKSEARPVAVTRSAARKSRRGFKPRGTSLEWVPIKDHNYDGFGAESGIGMFKALIAKNSIWALFYEIKDVGAKQLGCFRQIEAAKKKAQELHDKHWPETEFSPVTAGRIAKFCPAPTAGEGDGEETMTTTTKGEEGKGPAKGAAAAEEKAPEKPSATPGKTEAELDRELLASFASELERSLDEDDGED